MLGVKPDDRQASGPSHRESLRPGRRSTSTAASRGGLAFGEHGLRDHGLSCGYREGPADPPLPPEVVAAVDTVQGMTEERGMFFLDNVLLEWLGGCRARWLRAGRWLSPAPIAINTRMSWR